MYNDKESGAVHPLLVACIVLALLTAGLAGFSVWSFGNYLDYKDRADQKIEVAVTKAKKEQADQLEKNFIEREKLPYSKFNGPDDLGHVSFDYPKTWSVYIDNSGKGGLYQAYLNPGSVPTVSEEQPYATRVVIDTKTYEDTLEGFQSVIEKGELKSIPITVNGFTGIRLDGAFSEKRQGTSVVFKVRDKTLVVSSDATAFKQDFENVILKSLDFNP